jgi:hypothetical protein
MKTNLYLCDTNLSVERFRSIMLFNFTSISIVRSDGYNVSLYLNSDICSVTVFSNNSFLLSEYRTFP